MYFSTYVLLQRAYYSLLKINSKLYFSKLELAHVTAKILTKKRDQLYHYTLIIRYYRYRNSFR